ncbi:MAG: tRNA (N(6)-L-threonylcarbamoyladenosine(37)-C(2))-methylthiotransferase MtaB [Oscillospiraceae bacterium]|nr:tRNA (N(6)-L-threonylcarbamoyladenosine(37)-C(2))-methylthiotransferase MtaB [Oscillospiraceae bacterium]
MKISFYTLGCKVNQYESEAIGELFEAAGHSVVPIEDNPDFIIINSCTVTAESDRKTRQVIRKYKREHESTAIVLTGCMAQAFPEEAQKIFEADLVLGNIKHNAFVDIFEKYLKDKKRIIDVLEHEKGERFGTPSISKFSDHTRAFMKIEDGCNNFCSYCIIPKARGRVRSRSIEDIKKEAQSLAETGFVEVVLVGIDLSAYGEDSGLELCDAVKAVSEIDKIKRIRLGSLDSDELSDKVLEYLASCEKFCPQFHLSLQSGCDKTLKAMNRHYDAEFYRNLVDRIRQKFDNPSITTDIMVGFPGETMEDFNTSLDFAKEIGFARVHVFPYSRRKGTRAYDMDNQICRTEKESRSKQMIAVGNLCEAGFCASQVGLVSPVLFEQQENGFWEGYSPNYTRIKVKSNNNLSRQIKEVKIISAEHDFCYGEIVTE